MTAIVNNKIYQQCEIARDIELHKSLEDSCNKTHTIHPKNGMDIIKLDHPTGTVGVGLWKTYSLAMIAAIRHLKEAIKDKEIYQKIKKLRVEKAIILQETQHKINHIDDKISELEKSIHDL
jgi:hypothetical protein